MTYESAPGYSWFHGSSNKQHAEVLLQGTTVPNAFFVWQNAEGTFILSLKLLNQTPPVRHCRIIRLPNSNYQLDGAPHTFPDLRGVVMDYQNAMRSMGGLVAITCDGCPCDVTTPSAPPTGQLTGYPPQTAGPPVGSQPVYPPGPSTPYPPQQSSPLSVPAEPPPSYNDVVKTAQPTQVVHQQSATVITMTATANNSTTNTSDSSDCSTCLCQFDTVNYKWYDLRGKGVFPIIFLIFAYIIGGVLLLAAFAVMCVICMFCGGERSG